MTKIYADTDVCTHHANNIKNDNFELVNEIAYTDCAIFHMPCPFNSDPIFQDKINQALKICKKIVILVSELHYDSVKFFKEKLPLLNNIKQWIYREDYKLPKPDGQCYEVAKQKYYKNERYIFGIEDSMVGYKALKKHTDLIYIYDNEPIFKNNDCYLFNDFNVLI